MRFTTKNATGSMIYLVTASLPEIFSVYLFHKYRCSKFKKYVPEKSEISKFHCQTLPKMGTGCLVPYLFHKTLSTADQHSIHPSSTQVAARGLFIS